MEIERNFMISFLYIQTHLVLRSVGCLPVCSVRLSQPRGRGIPKAKKGRERGRSSVAPFCETCFQRNVGRSYIVKFKRLCMRPCHMSLHLLLVILDFNN